MTDKPLFAYLHVYSPGPMIIVRAPMKGKRGKREVAVKWSHLLRALTPVMKSHGFLKKDIFSIEALCHPDEWDPDTKDFWAMRNADITVPSALKTLGHCEAAFDGSPTDLAKFWLYAWTERSGGSFDLIREPTK